MTTRWGQARIEVVALKTEILKRLNSGATVGQIYNELKKDGRVTISSRQFYAWVKRFRDESKPPSTQSVSQTGTGAVRPPSRESAAALPIFERSRTTSDNSQIIDASTRTLPDEMQSGSLEDAWAGNFEVEPINSERNTEDGNN